MPVSGDRYLGDGAAGRRPHSPTCLSPFGGVIFRSLQMRGQKRLRVDILASQTLIFFHLTANVSKTIPV